MDSQHGGGLVDKAIGVLDTDLGAMAFAAVLTVVAAAGVGIAAYRIGEHRSDTRPADERRSTDGTYAPERKQNEIYFPPF